MPRYRRPKHQGVVYGPVGQRDRPEANLVGRLIGILVVLGAIAVLGLGAINLVGGSDDVATTPDPTVAAVVDSPSPTATATTRPTPTLTVTTPSPTIAALPSPSPATTPLQVVVREGPGAVTFGTQVNSALRVTDPRTTFELGERIRMTAQLTEPAASTELTIRMYRYDPATATEELVAEQSVRPVVSSASVFSRTLRPGRVLEQPGIYAVRYERDADVLAEGWLELTP